MSAVADAGLGPALRRIETLVAALDELRDPAAREPARELLERVLDLHGLALARVLAIVAAAGGRRLLDEFVEDDQVRAVLLLHGLHPHTAEERVRRAVEGLRPRLGAASVRLAIVEAGAASVRLRVERRGGNGSTPADRELRREIEETIVEAAPDLDEIMIEGLGDGLEVAGAGEAAALAG